MPEYTELALIRSIEGKVAHLEGALRGLYEHLGVTYPERGAGVPSDVLEALDSGDKVAAVRRYVEHTGASLRTRRQQSTGSRRASPRRHCHRSAGGRRSDRVQGAFAMSEAPWTLRLDAVSRQGASFDETQRLASASGRRSTTWGG